jgi:hypothetical protein
MVSIVDVPVFNAVGTSPNATTKKTVLASKGNVPLLNLVALASDLRVRWAGLNEPVGMDLDMQIKLFETALDELDQNSDLINQVLEITLDHANDAEFTIIRYELPTLPFPFPEGAARRTPGSPVRAARTVTRCWGETFLGR